MGEKKLAELAEELRFIELQVSDLLSNKQVIQIEIREIENAVEELKNTDDEVYKLVGNIMFRADKNLLLNELSEKKKILDSKFEIIEKQEKLLEKKSENLKKMIEEKVSKK